MAAAEVLTSCENKGEPSSRSEGCTKDCHEEGDSPEMGNFYWGIRIIKTKRKELTAAYSVPDSSEKCDHSFQVLEVGFEPGTEPGNASSSKFKVDILFPLTNWLWRKNKTSALDTGLVTIWPSEQILAFLLIEHSMEFCNLAVCELGAGPCGFAGLALAKTNQASEIWLTDGSLEAVSNLDRTLRSRLYKRSLSKTTVRAAHVTWGAESEVFCKSFLSQRFDVVMMGDCTAFKESHADLLLTATEILKPSGTLLICAPERKHSLRDFVKLAKSQGWKAVIMKVNFGPR